MTGAPPDPDDARLTRLDDGRALSTAELSSLVYDDLRRLADAYFQRETPGLTLQPTALVHEACAQLLGQRNQDWDNRGHFLAVAATCMRRILMNAARDRGRQKRGGDWELVTLQDGPGQAEHSLGLLDLEAALQRLEGIKERYARIVELRYFAGLSLAETADVLGVSTTVVSRQWAKARAWLEHALEASS
jgi:RNA polymerase sigma-70 factor (ECF subfamily)